MIRRLLPLLVIGACHRAPPPPLADRVEQRIHAAHPELTITRKDAATLVVRAPSGGTVEMSVGNLQIQCERRPDQCDQAMDNVVGSLETSMAQLAAAAAPPRREDVRAVLKDTQFLDLVKKRIAEGPKDKIDDNTPVVRPLAADIWISYVLDRPTSMELVTRGGLRKLGLDERALHELALANLGKALTSLPHKPFTPGSHVFIVQAGDDYESSRLLLPQLWRPIAREVHGRLLAAAPARHVVLFTGSADLNDVATLMSAARDLAAHEHHPISAAVLEFTGDGWRPARKLP